MKVLFIGGTGVISSASSELAVEKGYDLYHLNRGQSADRRPIPAVKHIYGDIRKPSEVVNVLKEYSFDVVVDWIAFTPEHIQTDIELFRGRVGQFVFISSASAYQTPPQTLPITEKTPLDNPYWQYSRNKIACERCLEKAHADFDFPYTIVRPSHTYDKTLLPFHGGYTVLSRILEEKPVILHGDGSSIWTLTHNSDFARGFVGLLGNENAVGEAFHITGNELITWQQIYESIAAAAGKKLNPVYVPSQVIAAYDSEWGASLLGDKTHSMIFDNSKINRLVPEFECRVPFAQGASEMVGWYSSNPDYDTVDPSFDALIERIIKEYNS